MVILSALALATLLSAQVGGEYASSSGQQIINRLWNEHVLERPGPSFGGRRPQTFYELAVSAMMIGDRLASPTPWTAKCQKGLAARDAIRLLSMSREAFIEMGGNPTELKTRLSAFVEDGFKGFDDVPISHWAAGAVDVLKNEGILVGYPSGAFQSSSKAIEQRFAKLGRARADFGDKPNSGVWKYVYSRMTATKIFFPAGRADVRYYCTPVHDSLAAVRVCKASKRNGRISLDWKMTFQAHRPKAVNYPVDPKDGTLGNIIRQWGMVIPVKLPKAVARAFADPAPLAYYYYDMEGGFAGGFVQKNGSKSDMVRLDAKRLDMMPRTLEPYPITAEERRALGAK